MQVEEEDMKPPRSLNSDSEVALDLVEKEFDELDDFEDEEANDDVFRIRDKIERPEAKTHTTRELHALIHEGAIDLSPDYQREVVWPETKQIHLIDSIFRNFYIPPIIFAVQVDEGEEVRVCVDGKQRLTSIQKFFDGQIPYRDSVTKKNYFFTLPDSRKKSQLDVPQHYKDWFSMQPITCVEYKNITPGTERDIFQRVQMGMPLVAAEKLQAMDSAWAQWISSLEQKHVHSDDGLSAVLDWAHNRGRAFQCLAHVIYLCDGLPRQLLPTAQKITQWIARVDGVPDGFKEDIENALLEFWIIAGDTAKGYNKGFQKIKKKVAPIEFAFIGLLMYVMRDNTAYSRLDRANAIYEMRKYIRGYFDDVRNRSDIGKRLWHFVQSIEHPGSVSLDEVLEGAPKKSRKRKVPARGDEEDEYRPEAVRNLGAPLKTRSTRKKR